MARESRRIGIQTARVRLPPVASAGSALVRTSVGIAEQEFAKAADIKSQEAQVAAAAINFERDGDGNLSAPVLPVSEEGLLTPSIYDRAYTKMVSTRYVNQSAIDVSEKLNEIATNNRFDPDAYRQLAESYIAKVTELAPDMLKPDVNSNAQVKMVEHFNRIVRVTAEREHKQAYNTQVSTIQNQGDEIDGYVMSGADTSVIGAAIAKKKASIIEGRPVEAGGYGFWDIPTMTAMMEDTDRQYAVSQMISVFNDAPNDPLVLAEGISVLDGYARGEGSIEMVDELGGTYDAKITDLFPDQKGREAFAKIVGGVFVDQQTAGQRLKDARVNRDWDNHSQWWTTNKVENEMFGVPLDTTRLYEDFKKADIDVREKGYSANYREYLGREIAWANAKNVSANPTKEQLEFGDSINDWVNRLSAETSRLLSDIESPTAEDVRIAETRARSKIGGVSAGWEQTKGLSRSMKPYYSTMTKMELDRPAYDFMIDYPESDERLQFENSLPLLGNVGIIQFEFIEAMKGRLQNPEGMSPDVLDSSIDLLRKVWEQPGFRANFTDTNAFGKQLGSALNNMFQSNVIINADTLRTELEKYRDPDYLPYNPMSKLSNDERSELRSNIENRLEGHLRNKNALGFGGADEGEVPMIGLNPFAFELAGLRDDHFNMVIDVLGSMEGRYDKNDPSSYDSFINGAVKQVKTQQGLIGSKLGFDANRYTNWNRTWKNWIRPAQRPRFAAVPFAPEYYIKAMGLPVTQVMEYVEKDFQKVLDAESKKRWPGENPHWIAGENAGLRKSGIDTESYGQAAYEIVLVEDDGYTQHILDNTDGTFEGYQQLFFLEDSVTAWRAENGDRFEEVNARSNARQAIMQKFPLEVGSGRLDEFYRQQAEKDN